MNWDLSVYYRDFADERIEADFAACEQLIREMGETVNLGLSPLETLEKEQDIGEELEQIFGKLESFAELTLSVDATNEEATRLSDRCTQMAVGLQLSSAALTRYVGKLTEEELEKLIASSEKLTACAFSLRRMREDAAHLPDEQIQEWLLNMSINGAQAFAQLRGKLDATLSVDYRGEKLPLSAVRAKAEDADPEVRRDAYLAELAAYPKIEHPMAACLNAIKGEGLTMIKAEHFDSILDQTLFNSNMDRETLEAMWTACREFFPAFRRYLRKKGELLGYNNGLPFFGLFAPVSIGEGSGKVYTVEEARDILKRELGKFTPEMAEFIDNAFEQRWIDMFPHDGKSGGAFCAGVPHCEQSRVLTNFVGSLGDVSTLAHELGHAWHNYCMKGLPLCMRHEPMPLAETASIFNETLLANALRETADKAERFMLIENSLQNSTQVIVDIYSRYLFETAVIEGRKTHTLSAEELKKLMLEAQDQSYGDGLDPEYRHPYMWACKSHYYSPGLSFYNFPYAFGLLFGLGVYALYREKGSAFVPDYKKLLRSCGSGMVADVAASVGINVRDPEFWRSSLRVVEDEIEQFVSMTDEYLKEKK